MKIQRSLNLENATFHFDCNYEEMDLIKRGLKNFDYIACLHQHYPEKGTTLWKELNGAQKLAGKIEEMITFNDEIEINL